MSMVTKEKIEKALDEKVRPYLKIHGGNVHVEQYKDGVLQVRMLGACSGCPSADLTVENLVDEKLREALPEIKQVVLVTGVSDAMIATARKMLSERHSRA